MLSSVVGALGHPYEALRRGAIEQLQSLGLDVTRIADKLVAALTQNDDQVPWFQLKAMMESLVALRGEGVTKLAAQDSTLAETIKDRCVFRRQTSLITWIPRPFLICRCTFQPSGPPRHRRGWRRLPGAGCSWCPQRAADIRTV